MVLCACTHICWQATATITATFECVYICLYIFEMPPLIENPANCEICSVIRYLSDKGVKAVENHRNVCEVYGQNIMSDGIVPKCVFASEESSWRSAPSGRDNSVVYHIRRQISMMKA